MIRRLKDSDIETVMSIWLNANIEAHSFVDPEYWKSSFDAVKVMIPQAETYVSEDHHGINGFVGVTDGYIAGIFVNSPVRSKGIGSQLLDFLKQDRDKLSLHVYKKNTAAVSFYLNRGFRIEEELVDPDTSETEYAMIWNR